MRRSTLPSEYELILLCARQKPKEEDTKKIIFLLTRAIDWNRLITAAQKHEILPLIYQSLKRLNALISIPDTTRKTLENAYYINLNRNLRFLREIGLLLEKFDTAGIKTIFLKGIALIETIYKNPALRTMADTDILIPEDKIAQTKQLLKQAGYQEIIKPLPERYIEKYQITFGFTKQLAPGISLYLDIHKRLIPDRPYPLKLPDIWKKAQSITIENQPMLTLSTEDTFLFVALHLRGHLRHFLLLKSLCDIAELLNLYGNTLDWEYIQISAKKNRIVNNIYFALYISKELLDASVSNEFLNRFRPGLLKRKLMHFCMNKYNFLNSKSWQWFILRFLIFDTFTDFLLYLLRVSLIERFIVRGDFIKFLPCIIKKNN